MAQQRCNPLKTESEVRMTEPMERRKKPSSDDPAKEQRIAEVRRRLEGMQPPCPSSLMMRATAFQGISLTNQLYLSGVKFSEKHWTHSLWWASRDLCANNVPLEEVLDLLIDTVDAWVDAERQDIAIRTIVNAFFYQPKVTAREYAQQRREGRGGAGSLTDTGAPAS
jgi:hypothetical protein